ncbi:MAG: TIGR00180 family glycosyltransferase [Desulfovibrionaceae bacterium]|nr:TIGR00180 family glycosyltransferase [Desulfovibrionaceae bacterium]
MPEDKATLVIPTHYRHGLLRRVLTYYRGSGLGTVVVDSTNKDFPHLAEFDVRYYSFKDWRFIDKLERPLDEISTPYLVFCADDCFIPPRAIETCVRFLDEHPDHATAQGMQVAIQAQGGEIELSACYESDAAVKIDSDRPEERLIQLFAPYSPTFYSVLRTENARDFVRLGRAARVNEVMLELVSAMAYAVCGKHRVLPIFYCANEIVPSILDKKGRRQAGADDVCTGPEHAPEFSRFCSTMAGYLAQKTGMDPKKAQGHIARSVDAFLGHARDCPAKKTFFQKLPKYARQAMQGAALRVDKSSLERVWEMEKLRDQERVTRFEDYFSRFDARSRAELERILELVGRMPAG